MIKKIRDTLDQLFTPSIIFLQSILQSAHLSMADRKIIIMIIDFTIVPIGKKSVRS
jgi:hypothetical protein